MRSTNTGRGHAAGRRGAVTLAQSRSGRALPLRRSWGGLIRFALLALLSTAVSAQDLPPYIERPVDAADVVAIWPGDGVPPGSEGWTWHEQSMQAPWREDPSQLVRNVVVPTLTVFKAAEGTANGTAVIVAPGGAFHFLMTDHEGYDVARWLTQRGVTAFVLKYRVQHTPENDADMPAFLEQLWNDLPHVAQTEVDPPKGHPPVIALGYVPGPARAA